ncbi:hypothetical protein H6P81_013931 [Aristolochia fimbriata]|uniref:Protein E6-like n=1 Tax=Aristolochia fimbriata TaxID=158543 RepID=A0AAV7EG24_ARIFI|nr:hypothetical protein H6P81_013931 [Aristolochia fimbriata]
MASPSPKCLSLLLILLFSSLSTEARVSEFFSKTARFEAADPAKGTPAEARPTDQLSPTKVDEDPNAFTFTPENGSGHGLYAHSDQETEYPGNTPAQEFHVGDPKGKGSSRRDSYPNPEVAEFDDDDNTQFDNDRFAARYPEKEERNPAEFESRREEAAPRGREYDDNVEATKEYEEGRFGRRNDDAAEHYGMSDTRTLENGRYFYNVKNENYRGNPYATNFPSYRNEGYYGRAQNRNEYRDEAANYKGGEYQNPQDDPSGYNMP